MWFWDHRFHILRGQTCKDLPSGADPMNRLQGLPNPWDVTQTLVCVYFSDGRVMALIHIWSSKYQGPLSRSLIMELPPKNLILPRLSTKLGKHLVIFFLLKKKKKLTMIDSTKYARCWEVYYYDLYSIYEENEILIVDPCCKTLNPWC